MCQTLSLKKSSPALTAPHHVGFSANPFFLDHTHPAEAPTALGCSRPPPYPAQPTYHIPQPLPKALLVMGGKRTLQQVTTRGCWAGRGPLAQHL